MITRRRDYHGNINVTFRPCIPFAVRAKHIHFGIITKT